MKRISGIEVVIWCGALLIYPPHADGDEIFLLELGPLGGRAVWQVNLDGSDLKRISLPSNFSTFAAIGFNHADQKLYWSEHFGSILRSSPNGDDVELVIGPGESNPMVPLVDGVGGDAHALAFDQQFIYWGAGAEPYLISRLNRAAEADDRTDYSIDRPWKSLGIWSGRRFDIRKSVLDRRAIEWSVPVHLAERTLMGAIAR